MEGGPYMKFLPSKLAASSIALARHTIDVENPWPKSLAECSGYQFEELVPIMKCQHVTFRDSPTKPQQAIQTKYKTDKYHRVGLLKPKAFNF